MLDLLQHYFGVNSCYLKYSSSVIPVRDTGMALLHSTLSSDGLRQIYVMISNLAIPIPVNLLSK
ncbi:hypothetical protein JR053_02985 [Wolbachia endosymbiont of Nasonia vitripennis]|uniref:hypothetical protein n=1 Tax=Wolbachia endosymbiont of Nasonia vitripennis TaxID=180837 RepID=UPI003A8519DF